MSTPALQSTLPQAAEPFVAFSAILRNTGFSVAPEQTIGFLDAIGLLGPRDMHDIRRAAHALLSPPIERRPEFDALFDAHFLGRAITAETSDSSDAPDDLLIQDAGDERAPPPQSDEVTESGTEATAIETLSQRDLSSLEENRVLQLFERTAPSALPERRSYRRIAAKSGRVLNLRRMLKDAAKHDGEIITLPKLKRKTRLRRIVLLIDISGSMKAQSNSAFRFAHALCRCAGHVEAFTIGTRLTRATRAMRLRNRTQALEEASRLVADWDGGTRIGHALQAFLAVPRYVGFSRGSYILVLSDGLERGDPTVMVDAVSALSRLAWAVDWMTPLADAEGFTPRTEALSAATPYLSSIADGSSIESLCRHVLQKARSP